MMMDIQEELPLNHEPSLDHWAQGVSEGYYSNWDHAYESEWMYLDAEFNYNYEYREATQ
jgi:3-methyladenine DNA glycosylase AlkD